MSSLQRVFDPSVLELIKKHRLIDFIKTVPQKHYVNDFHGREYVVDGLEGYYITTFCNVSGLIGMDNVKFFEDDTIESLVSVEQSILNVLIDKGLVQESYRENI